MSAYERRTAVPSLMALQAFGNVARAENEKHAAHLKKYPGARHGEYSDEAAYSDAERDAYQTNPDFKLQRGYPLSAHPGDIAASDVMKGIPELSQTTFPEDIPWSPELYRTSERD